MLPNAAQKSECARKDDLQVWSNALAFTACFWPKADVPAPDNVTKNARARYRPKADTFIPGVLMAESRRPDRKSRRESGGKTPRDLVASDYLQVVVLTQPPAAAASSLQSSACPSSQPMPASSDVVLEDA